MPKECLRRRLAKYTRARENGLPRGDAPRGGGLNRSQFLVPLLVARLLAGVHFRARACISPESRKLETTRRLEF